MQPQGGRTLLCNWPCLNHLPLNFRDFWADGSTTCDTSDADVNSLHQFENVWSVVEKLWFLPLPSKASGRGGTMLYAWRLSFGHLHTVGNPKRAVDGVHMEQSIECAHSEVESGGVYFEPLLSRLDRSGYMGRSRSDRNRAEARSKR
eukprot:2009436-Amphidinium_carterae.2